jgi:RecB family endonuclease NucS
LSAASRPARSAALPTPFAAREFLRAEFGRALVVLVGRCSITYEGRARSVLPEGERLILCKPDGTLLVHTASKLKPVNWQPPGCVFGAAVEEGTLVVSATRDRPRETIRIAFESLAAAQAFDLEDEAELALDGTEEDLRSALQRVPTVLEEGLTIWARERASGRGPMDLYGEDRRGARVVIEVKRRGATVADVEQLRRYVEREKAARAGPVRGILAAPSVSPSAKKYLDEIGLEAREIDLALIRARASQTPAGQVSLAKYGDGPDGP